MKCYKIYHDKMEKKLQIYYFEKLKDRYNIDEIIENPLYTLVAKARKRKI